MLSSIGTHIRTLLDDETGNNYVDLTFGTVLSGIAGGLVIYGTSRVAPNIGANMVTNVTAAQGAVTFADGGTNYLSDVNAGNSNAGNMTGVGSFTAP